MKHHVRRGRVALRRALGTSVAVLVIALAAASASADPGDVGYEGPSYTGGATHITGEKPQSKVWWNDGFWWASLYDPTTTDYYIHKLDLTTQTWVKTATRLDDRPSSRADTLWDQTAQKLYVASHTSSGSGRLWRFSYNASTDTYTKDTGFPATIVGANAGEALVIDKDSTGQLWATWEQNSQIWVNRTTGADNTWGTPFVPNVDGAFPGAASAVSAQDISAVVAFEGKIGLMWSNEVHQVFYFAVHNDADADDVWQPAIKVREGSGKVDDHVALKSFQSTSDGRLYAATKTTSTNGIVPGIELQVRSATGTWTTHTVTSAEYNQTRPIVVINGSSNTLHVFTSEEGDGAIYEKVTPLGAISFADGKGTPVMVDADNPGMNNPSSTKQVVTNTTGLVVIGHNNLTSKYWHHYDPLGGAPPPNAIPVATGDAYSTAQNTPLSVPAPGVLANDTDGNGQPLTAAKVTDPVHGSVTLNANGSFTYTPKPSFWGTDSFTYRASDGIDNSAPATVTITVNNVGGAGSAFSAVADTYVRSSSPNGVAGTATTIRTQLNGSSITRSLVRFNVAGLTGSPAWAKLRLYVKNTSPAGGAVYSVANNTWVENSVTWNTAPALGSLYGNVGPATPINTWVEIDVTGAVTGNGLHSFAVDGQSSDIAYYQSKEGGANAPQLVLGAATGPPNNAPVAANDSYAMQQGTTLNVAAPGVLGNDTDADGNPLTAAKLTNPASGTLTFNANGSFSYTPAPSFTGTASFTYQANDGTANSNTATVNITVSSTPPPPAGTTFNPVADTFIRSAAPSENNGSATTVNVAKGGGTETRGYLKFTVSGLSAAVTSATLRLFVTDASATNVAVHTASNAWSESTLTWSGGEPMGGQIGTIPAGPAGQWVELNVTSVVTGNGTYTFGLGGLSTDLAMFSSREGANKPELRINGGGGGGGGNTAPVASNDSYTMTQGTTLTVNAPGVLGNDTDADSNPLTAAKLSDPANGTLNFNANGSFTYTPSVVFTGGVSFTYRANDGTANSNTATVNITVNPSGGGGGGTTFAAVADTFVRQAAPSENNGSASTLDVSKAAGAEVRTYMRFTVSGLSGSYSSKKLRLYVKDTNPSGVNVHFVTNWPWNESTLTWFGAEPVGALIGTIGASTVNTWVELNVGSHIPGNGTYTIALVGVNADLASFGSRESAEKPELVFTP